MAGLILKNFKSQLDKFVNSSVKNVKKRRQVPSTMLPGMRKTKLYQRNSPRISRFATRIFLIHRATQRRRPRTLIQRSLILSTSWSFTRSEEPKPQSATACLPCLCQTCSTNLSVVRVVRSRSLTSLLACLLTTIQTKSRLRARSRRRLMLSFFARKLARRSLLSESQRLQEASSCFIGLRTKPESSEAGTTAKLSREFIKKFLTKSSTSDVNPESWTKLSGFSCIKNTQKKNGRKPWNSIKQDTHLSQ